MISRLHSRFQIQFQFILCGVQMQTKEMEFLRYFTIVLFSLILNVSGSSKHGNCGGNYSSENRVFGGEVVQKNSFEFPWLVALHHRIMESFFCAGSLISNKHVLTGRIKLKLKSKVQFQFFFFRLSSGPLHSSER